ncbi:DUF6191 domain-containing protein [Streptomyces sp. NBC_00057]|uniref:DUF6191 domain-containing protein n=1 Tax=Streptomyces sp. NBC_00057 TaxID=2975634 RepID=UPI003249A2AA
MVFAVALLLALIGISLLRWINRKRGQTSDSTANFEFMEVFHPSQQHVREESQRQQLLREDEGMGAPPLDLDSGRAFIVSPPRKKHEDEGH